MPVESPWEPVSWRHQNGAIKDFWGVFHADDYAPEPVAIFSSEADANDWLAFMRKHPDEDRRFGGGDFAVCLLRGKPGAGSEDEDVLYSWNSYDLVQESGP